MSNTRIEDMLYDAKENLPTTEITLADAKDAFELSQNVLEESRNTLKDKKKSLHFWQKMAACFVTLLLLGVGTVTVLANIDSIKELFRQEKNSWSDRIVWVDEQCELFEGFSLGDYKEADTIHPAIYNEELCVVFHEKGIFVIEAESEEKYEIALPKYVYDNLQSVRVSSELYDVNGDGVEELILSSREHGTNLYLYYVDIIDFKNKITIPLDYEVEMLVKYMPVIEIVRENYAEDGTRKSIDIRYEMQGKEYVYTLDLTNVFSEDLTFRLETSEQDARTFCEDGTIRVDTSIGFSTNGIYLEDYVGSLVGTLLYDSKTQRYVLEKDSIHIEWMN